MSNKTLKYKLSVKAADEDQWTFTGVASTPEPDRMRDTVDPQGAQFSLPLPLLWQHDHSQPIGQITAASVSDTGIEIPAQIHQPQDDTPSQMAGRLREAWYSIKNQLVTGLSIGFVPSEYEPNDSGGLHISSYDLMEISAVTVAANAAANIQTVKHGSATLPDNRPHEGFTLRQTHFVLRNT